MSKRATDAAWQLYPDYPAMDGGYVTQRKQRELVMEGYEQAEKDTIERAVKWMKNNWIKYPNSDIPTEVVVDNFKKAMEEEK